MPFVSVVALYWFLSQNESYLGMAISLISIFLAQSRYAYLATFALFLILPAVVRIREFGKVAKLLAMCGFVGLLLSLIGEIPGRLGVPVSINTVIQQLSTLLGSEGPGAGSFRHRLVIWPWVIQQVVSNELEPVLGIGLRARFNGWVHNTAWCISGVPPCR